MVEIDWKSFISLKPENLSEQDKENLYDTVAWYTGDFNLEKKYLIQFVRVSQEILKFKGEQVNLLTSELDDLAAKQGKEEGSKLQQYIEEIEQLKEELEYNKKLDRSSSRSPHASSEELQRELVKLEMQNEELLNELNEKEKELLNEKEEVERYAAQVGNLEREKLELSRELRALQDEAADKRFKSLKDSPEINTEKHELTEIIRQKNHHISQLLEDMEVIEEENLSLRTKLTSVRDELAETTTHITEITTELTKFKHLNEEYEMKIANSEEMIKSLQYQVEELVEEKSKQDKQLDEYIQMFNTKLQEWKDEVEVKDEEILKLKEEMKKISSPRVFTSDSNDTKVIQLEREIQILQEELAKATEEINSSTELIEKLKEKQFQSVSAPVHSQSIKFFEEKIKVLEEKLSYAEEDALVKAEKMSELVIQLREYESGVFGLSEAVTKIKKLEKTTQKKDAQIEKLVEICNNLEIRLDNLEDQNLCLRERLGLSASDIIDTSGVELKYKKDEELLSRLKLQLDQKEEELIKAKMKYRKVIKFLKLHPISQTATTTTTIATVADTKQDALIKENDALRKGMHEILESVRNSSGSVEVQSECLERLLEALDARHISGWYHPAMRLQAQLSTEEGKNEELRNQIRNLRCEEKKITNELQNAYRKIESLELESTPRYETTEELENQLREVKQELKKTKAKLEELGKSFADEKESLLEKISELENNQPKLENLEKLSESCRLQVTLMRNTEQIKREMMKQEENLSKEMLKLQNDNTKLLATIQQLQNDILNSVSKEKHESLIKELNCFKTKYQNAIGLALTSEKHSDNNQTEIELLEKEKDELLEELKKTKTKLIATEVLVREESVTKDLSSEISTLAAKLASSETRELNERQKSTHAEKMNEILKTQQKETETRNEELQTQVSKLTEELVKLEEREKELETKILNGTTEEERESLEKKAKALEKKCEELTTERDNIQELFEISQGQCRALQEWKDGDKILLASANEQILLLQSGDENKEKISRLSHELAMTKLTTSQLTKKNSDLKMKITKLLTRNLSLELKIEDNNREMFETRKKHLTVVEYLLETIDEIRERHIGTVPFKNAEDIYYTKKQIREKKKELEEKTKQLKTQIQTYETEKEKIQTQKESLEDLKAGLKGDAKNLIAWHNKTTELRLKETKTRRENEFLKGEVAQLETCVRKLNEEITNLEEENIQREKEWERKQMLWEKTQLELFGVKKKRVNDAWTNTKDIIPKDQEMEKGNGKVIETDETEKEALRVTVESLQNIIKQKEETIVKYQELLKEGREEYSKACGKLQEEVRSLNEALTNQTKAYNKLRNSVHEKEMANEGLPEMVEKYVTKIHELEEELREAEMSLSSVSAEVRRREAEVEKYRKLAEEKERDLEDIKKRLENDQKKIDDNHEQELIKYQKEIERLTEFIDLLRTENLKPISTEEKPKSKDQIRQIEKSDQLSDCTFDKPRKQSKITQEVETLQKQLKFAKEESNRLREQIRSLQAKPQKRPKTTDSGKEESLTGKIKNLEELLTMSKEREKELMEVNQKKLKSVEEVARWEERKKSQQTIQNLTGKLKEKEAEVEILKTKNESFRNLIYKCERDKAVLESQLKSVKDGPGGLNSKIEKLTMEKQELETEILTLRTKLQEQIRHSSGLGAALLEEKLEEQERKLATYELACKGQNALLEELERIKTANSNLEKTNLKLESENLSLQLKLEKEKAEVTFLMEKIKCEAGSGEAKRQETVSHLQKIIDKLKEENKKLKSSRKESRSCDLGPHRLDLAKIKEEHEELKAKYLESMSKNSGLESELKSLRYQLHLMEEKDLAEALARTTSFQANAELEQELIEVKAKLAQKNELMAKVKGLLVKAAAKEKALVQQVAALQSLLPKPLDSCC